MDHTDKRTLYRLKLLLSRLSCHIITAGLSILIITRLIDPLDRFIKVNTSIPGDKTIKE